MTAPAHMLKLTATLATMRQEREAFRAALVTDTHEAAGGPTLRPVDASGMIDAAPFLLILWDAAASKVIGAVGEGERFQPFTIGMRMRAFPAASVKASRAWLERVAFTVRNRDGMHSVSAEVWHREAMDAYILMTRRHSDTLAAIPAPIV